MFHHISWHSYWLTLALLVAGYYLVIYLLYYRSDFKIEFPRKSSGDSGPFPTPLFDSEKIHSSEAPSSLPEYNSTDFQRPEAGTEEQVVYSCMDELTAFFEEARSRKWIKEDLIHAMQSILRKYPTLPSSCYKESLSNVLSSECKHHCSIHLSAEDVVQVWSGV